MTARQIRDPEKPIPSAVYTILRRSEQGYTEIGVDARGELFIRHTLKGKVLSIIPLGPATINTLVEINMQLDEVARFINPDL